MVRYYLAAATEKDFDFVYQLKKIAYREYIEQTWGWDDAFQIKFHKENFSARNTLIIMEDELRVGSVDIKDGAGNIFISGLYILPQYQGKGIGTSIITELIQQAESQKKRLELEVLRVNSPAQRLYERLGFLKVERDDKKLFMYKDWSSEESVTGDGVRIIPFDRQYISAFAALNRAWLEKYFAVESIDEAIFAQPYEYIIEKGGYIFFATLGEKIAGTFALMKAGEGVFELSKMAVAETFQGQKIGNKMLDFCLQKAKDLNAAKLILYSNTALQPAIHLYRKYGFREVPLGSVEYKRANIKMEFDLKK